MQVQILCMRRNGRLLSRRDLRAVGTMLGDLEVLDTRENSYNRILKIARCRDRFDGHIVELFDVRILWMQDDKFCLTGFEREKTSDGLVDYAQSWVCRLSPRIPEFSNEKIMPPHEDFRL